MNLLALLTIAGISSISNGSAETTKVSISDLDLTVMQQDWAKPQKNLSVDKNPLTIAGRKFEKGVGTHSNSFMCLRVSGKALRFTAMVGVDGEVGKKGSVNFVLNKDSKKIWESGVMRGGDAAKAVDIDLRGVGRLSLIVEETSDGFEFDHADWADATIEMVKDAPAPVLTPIPVDPPMKIASGNAQNTQIHGPRIVGTTPGHAFLFKIPATGKKPLVFSARGLPQGLSLSSETGIISGRVEQAGEYKVAVEVKGTKGKDAREITIVGGKRKLALTPPMGWNSWNCWGNSVTADKVRDSGRVMIESGLADYGYQYVNIDDCWEGVRDAKGEIQSNERFGDMTKLSAEIHGMGLKLGIYTSPGPYTCNGLTGSYQHEFQDAKTYAKWGIDYLKHDWCSYDGVVKDTSLYELQKPYILMRDALDANNRDIVYSLCQYGMGDVYKWGYRIGGNLWRTTGDIWDDWSRMVSIGFSQSEKSPYVKPGGWNDPDMLVVGMVGWGPNLHPSRLTANEQITHITLWSMLAAPLIIGCDMTQMDQFTKDLLMNHDVIEVDQDPLGKAAVRVWQDGSLEVWTRPLWDGSMAVALFNRGFLKAKLSVTWKELSLDCNSAKVRDLWIRKDLGTMVKGIARDVPSHGAMMFKVTPIR